MAVMTSFFKVLIRVYTARGSELPEKTSAQNGDALILSANFHEICLQPLLIERETLLK
jgi:hypothetical protein